MSSVFRIAVVLVAAATQASAQSANVDAKLEARIAAEKESRKQCKTDICQVLGSKKAGGAPITCSMTKTWVEDEIKGRLLGGKLSWPWSHAQCTARVELSREDLAKLVASPDATVKLKKHDVKCTIDSKEGKGEAYAISLAITPEITFKGGKATKVVMGWGDVQAPVLAKSAIWSATAVDNTFNVLNGTIVSEINTFMFQHCKEVGVDIPEPK